MFPHFAPVRGIALSLVLALSSLSASAATLNPDEILTQFNLVVFGDHRLDSQVHGRAFIGGNVTGNSGSITTSNYTLPASAFADVTIGGNVTSGAVNTVQGATVQIGGNNSTRINNAGSVLVGGTSVRINPPVTVNVSDLKLNIDSAMAAIRATMTLTSQTLRELDQTATLTRHSQGVRFDAEPTDGRVVYNIGAADLTGNEIGINLGGADTVVINVSGKNISFGQNFNTSESVGANVLWNFYEAETLALNNRFVGSVLAPNAAFTNGNNVFGSVIVSSFAQGGQIHQQAWAGTLHGGDTPAPIPLPAAGWLLLGAVGALAALRRRRAYG